MGHYMKMYDSEYLASWDFEDNDVTVTISKVVQGELRDPSTGSKAKKPLVYFKGAEKALVLNKTNGRIVADMYGTDADKWIGKAITLYAGPVEAFGKTVGSVKVRPEVPKEKA